MKEVLIGIALFVSVIVAIMFFNYGSYSFFAPKYAEVRNQVFHESQAYNDGMLNDLSSLRIEYSKATSQDHKDVIRSTVRQRFASYPRDKMPPELRNFYESMVGVM